MSTKIRLFIRTAIGIILQCITLMAYAQNSGGACITSRTYTTSDASSYIVQKVYDNGLGDVVEEVSVGITPSGKDLVTLHEYDAYRRPVRKWLPVASSGSTGDFVASASLKSSSVSQYGDSYAYGKTIYDALHFDNPGETYRAGNAWQSNSKRTVSTYIWKPGEIQFVIPSPGLLFVTQTDKYLITRTTDEDGCWHEEYTDITGRRIADCDATGKTFYVYDHFGNLVYVLPQPVVSYAATLSSTTPLADNDDIMRKYAYIYKYDYLRRCIYKKLPGCEPIYYIYDAAGNCILSQDGVQRSRGEWMFSIPDKFGRACLKGICKNSYSYSSEPLHGVFVYASPLTSSSTGYSISGLTLSSPTYHEISYYDNYSFIGKNGVPTSLSYSSPPSGFPARDANAGRGLLTGRTVAYSDNTGIKGSVHIAYYYDYRRRVVQSRSTNAKGGSDIVYAQYTFTGKPLKVRSNHSSEAVSNLLELTEYSYDHAERLLTVDHTIGSGGKRRLQQNTYDTFGRLSARQRFGKTALNTQYGYNIQSSLKSLSTGNLFGETLYYQENYNGNTPKYNGGISAMTWSASGANVLRGYRFSYDQKSRLTSALYLVNGSHSTNYDVSYGYDSMGNITSLVRNGRQDGGTWGKVNQLTYSYNGNQLTKVTDNVSSPTYNGFFGFIDGADHTTEYEYDANGNMTKDRNKGISCITYNTMNLPSRIEYENGSRATYLYSADGTKLQVKYETSYAGLLASGPPSGSTSTTIAQTHTIDYVGNKIYEDGELSRILIEGGYVDYSGETPIYHTYLTDHQGNVRVVVDENAAVKQVNHYYPFGALFAESTNGGVQPYKYNGKELDRMHGLDWYDHGARHNDAAIGRWHVMDPLCEKYYDVSPYAYCADDPVNAIDPDGKSIWTKMLKTTMKIGSRVASNGLKELGKAATYAEAVSDIKENANTVVDGNASTIDRIGAGVSLASELLPISFGDVKDVVKIVKNVHGNSKLSTKAQHAYDIIDKRTDKVVKTGISGGKIRKDGKSYRAEQQVRKWNKEEGGYIYESEITHQEPAGAGARDKILKYEKDRANTLYNKEELDENKHKRP